MGRDDKESDNKKQKIKASICYMNAEIATTAMSVFHDSNQQWEWWVQILSQSIIGKRNTQLKKAHTFAESLYIYYPVLPRLPLVNVTSGAGLSEEPVLPHKA